MRERDPLGCRSPILMWLFGWYLRWYFQSHFHGVRISLTGLPENLEGRPLIVYSNHPSWWDPALYILLLETGAMHDRIGFGPMDEQALKKYGLMRRMGVFGIDPGSKRGAADFLRIGRRVLQDPRRSLWITAEGGFTDPRRRPVTLRPGIAHLARRVPGVVLLPMAIEYTFWNETRPEVLIRFGAPIEGDTDMDVSDWTALLTAELTSTMDGLAAESMTRDAALFRPLLKGISGVGGIYDLWRGVRSWSKGQRFDPSHGAAAEHLGDRKRAIARLRGH